MTYTAIFQTSAGRLSMTTIHDSNDRNIAWKNIHANREDDASSLLLLIPGIHIVYRREDVLDDE
jgi:hypothetical protein